MEQTAMVVSNQNLCARSSIQEHVHCVISKERAVYVAVWVSHVLVFVYA